MKSLHRLIVWPSLIFINACSGSSNKSSADNQFKDSYDYTYNGCPTGTHSFAASSKEELREKVCAALIDDSLNKNCAFPIRKDRFDIECIGTSVHKKLTEPVSALQPSLTPPKQQVTSQKNTQELKAQEIFNTSVTFGDHQWKPSKLNLIIRSEIEAATGKSKDKKVPSKSSKNAMCTTKNFMTLKGQYPSVYFTLGSLECNSNDDSINKAVQVLSHLTTGLKYKAVHIPAGDLEKQFRLDLEMLPTLYLPPHLKVDNFGTVGSLNSLIKDESLFLDLIIPIRSILSLEDDPSFYALEIHFQNKTEILSHIRIELTISKAKGKEIITLEGALNE